MVQWRLSSVTKTVWLAAILLIVLALQVSAEFILDGSLSSFARFPPWRSCSNASMSFDFKAARPDGLLLYTDDGGSGSDFLELKLINGAIQLRWSLSSEAKAEQITLGNDLADGHWHHVQLNRDGPLLIFSIDEDTEEISTSHGEFGDAIHNSPLFIGGLPAKYTLRLSMLALPTVMFEPRFAGAVRRLVYEGCGEEGREIQMVDNRGVRLIDSDACRQGNPCRHGGVCVSIDAGIWCDCRGTGYEGQFCNKELSGPKATFFGTEYLSYDLTNHGQSIVSSVDQVDLYFKTKQANSLLFYTGDGEDFLTLTLQGGSIALSINLAMALFNADTNTSTRVVRYNDNKWHHIVVKRISHELIRHEGHCVVQLTVDETFQQTGTILGRFPMLSSRQLLVGGGINLVPGNRSGLHENFKGCLKQVFYKADSIELDVLDLAIRQHDLLSSHGNILYNKCEDLTNSQPVCFSGPKSYIELPALKLGSRSRENVSFHFTTTESNGLLFYGSGALQRFLAVELLDGFIHLVVNAVGDVQRVVTEKNFTDGSPHRVVVSLNSDGTGLTVDGHYWGQVDGRLRLAGPLYLGGVHPNHSVSEAVWSKALQYGYVGCMAGVRVSAARPVLTVLARQQVHSGVQLGCVNRTYCHSAPCLHGGRCMDGWNRYVCDCTATSYVGPSCETAAVTLNFNGSQYFVVDLGRESRSEVEDVTLRFRTQQSDGMLWATSSNTHDGHLQMVLDGGRVRFNVDLGDTSKSVFAGSGLDDGRWHTIHMKRRARRIRLQADHGEISQATLDGSANGVYFNQIQVARRPIHQDTSGPLTAFIGSMQSFMYNGNDFFRMGHSNGIENIRSTASIDNTSVDSPDFAVTFRTQASHVIAKHQLHDTFALRLRIKTTQSSGLLLYSGAADGGHDFLALELMSGRPRYVFNVGSGPRVVNSDVVVNNNRWHDIAVIRPALDQHILRVDDTANFDILPDTTAVHFDLNGHIYVGGASKRVYGKLSAKVSARHGYQGCVADLDVNGQQRPLLDYAKIPRSFQDDILDRCEGPNKECTETTCANGGVCIQEWESFTCNCDRTSFMGERCDEDSTAYSFGKGVITYTYPKKRQPSTKKDELTLGFMTSTKDAVLARIEGESGDYIQMELVDGNVFVIYNMGTMDHPIGELFESVDDNKYHVVRFTRSGQNATIQIDDLVTQTKNPTVIFQDEAKLTGKQLRVFDKQARIEVGGKLDHMGNIVRTFEGKMAGFVFNGIRVLDLAAKGDRKVTVRGDGITLDLRPIPYRPTEAAKLPSTMGSNIGQEDKITDDLIVTKRVLDCQHRGADCVTPSATDSLITVKNRKHSTSPHSPTTAVPPVIAENSGMEPCNADDIDSECGDAEISGDGVQPAQPTSSTTTPADNIRIKIETDTHDETTLKSTTQTTTTTITTTVTTMTPVVSQSVSSTSAQTTKMSPPPGGAGDTGSAGGTRGEVNQTKTKGSSLSVHIILILAIGVAAVLLILLLAFAFYKYRSRDEGSYKVNEGSNYAYEACDAKPSPCKTSVVLSKSGSDVAITETARLKKDVKEWYV